MMTNLKLKKAIKLRSEQDNLRIKALNKGVELIAPETIFLSKDTTASFLSKVLELLNLFIKFIIISLQKKNYSSNK